MFHVTLDTSTKLKHGYSVFCSIGCDLKATDECDLEKLATLSNTSPVVTYGT